MKVFIVYLVLFILYHLSEFVGSNVILILLILALFLPISHLAARFLGGKGIGSWGLDRHNGNMKNLLFGYLVGVFFYLIFMFVSVRNGQISFAGEFSFTQVIPLTIGMVVLTFFSSASEDILTRGFVFRYLSIRYSNQVVVLISSLIFTLNHIWILGNGWHEWVSLFLLGIALSIPLARTGSLWFTLGCHWGWNTISIFKDHIGDSTYLQIIDHTTNLTYIITIILFIVFNLWFSKYLSKSRRYQLNGGDLAPEKTLKIQREMSRGK